MKELQPLWVGKEGDEYGYKTETGVGVGFKSFDLALSAARDAIISGQDFDPFTDHKGKNIVFRVPNGQRWVRVANGKQTFYRAGQQIFHADRYIFRRLF